MINWERVLRYIRSRLAKAAQLPLPFSEMVQEVFVETLAAYKRGAFDPERTGWPGKINYIILDTFRRHWKYRKRIKIGLCDNVSQSTSERSFRLSELRADKALALARLRVLVSQYRFDKILRVMDLVEQGNSCASIGRALGVSDSSVWQELRAVRAAVKGPLGVKYVTQIYRR